MSCLAVLLLNIYFNTKKLGRILAIDYDTKGSGLFIPDVYDTSQKVFGKKYIDINRELGLQ